MELTITIDCPHCQSTKVVKNGKKEHNKQNLLCKNCKKQFIPDYQGTYKGTYSSITKRIHKMLVRACGIPDIAAIEECSISKVLSVLSKFKAVFKPKKSHYDRLEVDEFWSYVGKKKAKMWLLYVYDPCGKEIVAWVFGKRNMVRVRALRAKLKTMGIDYKSIAHDCWQAFKTVFKSERQLLGKAYTKSIEGNNCRLRHRIRGSFRRTCCFSKKLRNHIKAFEIAFFYLNYGYI